MGECIGIMGSTGSGKSTTLDLLMGLLEPTSGNIFVDDFDLYDAKSKDRVYRWRAGIAHVPQNIFLADLSILQNIAFGISLNSIEIHNQNSMYLDNSYYFKKNKIYKFLTLKNYKLIWKKKFSFIFKRKIN